MYNICQLQVVRVKNKFDPKLIEEYILREDLPGTMCSEGCVYSKKGFNFLNFIQFWAQFYLLVRGQD